jgi:hypothetical protein
MYRLRASLHRFAIVAMSIGLVACAEAFQCHMQPPFTSVAFCRCQHDFCGCEAGEPDHQAISAATGCAFQLVEPGQLILDEAVGRYNKVE